MKRRYHKIPVRGNKALEMAMSNVLGGLEDAASYFAYRSTPDTLEILSIECPKADPFAQHRPLATVHHVLSKQRSEDIVEFLMTREKQAEQLHI